MSPPVPACAAGHVDLFRDLDLGAGRVDLPRDRGGGHAARFRNFALARGDLSEYPGTGGGLIGIGGGRIQDTRPRHPYTCHADGCHD